MNIFKAIKLRLAQVTKLWIRPSVFPIDTESLNLDADATTIYVLDNDSTVNIVAARKALSMTNLPSVEVKTWHFLTQHRGNIFARKKVYKPEAARPIIERARAGEQIQLIPISLFWGREPKESHSIWRLMFSINNYEIAGGLRRFLSSIWARKDLEVHISKPLDVNLLLRDGAEKGHTRKLQRVLRAHFRRTNTAVSGPDLSHRRTLVSELVASRTVQNAIKGELENSEDSEAKLEARAKKYADEIVSNYNPRAVKILDKFLTWFWTKIYDGVEVEGIDKVRDLARTHTLVYLPCHRSHIDYLLLSYTLFKQGLMIPHIAAGINLNMPVVGRLLRGAGAFFIRRSFRGNTIYTAVFNEYLHLLLKRGFPVEFYIEGGRSRTGRSLPPKTGMLALMLRSYLRDSAKPIALVPIYVGYEKVLEEYTYLGELRGKSKKSESVFDIFKVFKVLKQPHGKVRANFADPLLLSDFLDQQKVDWRNLVTTKPNWLPEVTNRLGDEIITRINEAAHVNPTALVATSLLGAPKQALSEDVLLRQIEFNKSLLADMPNSTATSFEDISAEEAISKVVELKYLHASEDEIGHIYQLGDVESALMTYYRNNTLHLFVVPSMIAYALSNKRGIGRRQLVDLVLRTYPYLRRELFTNLCDDKISEQVNAYIDYFIKRGLIRTKGATLVGASANTAEHIQLRLLASYCQPILERFYIVIRLLANHGSSVFDADTLEARSVLIAQRMSIIHGINSPEFFDKRLFKGFIAQLQHQDIIECDEDGLLKFGKRLIETSHLAERVISADVSLNLMLATPVEQ